MLFISKIEILQILRKKVDSSVLIFILKIKGKKVWHVNDSEQFSASSVQDTIETHRSRDLKPLSMLSSQPPHHEPPEED